MVWLAVLNLAELNLHPRPCPRYSLFLCWKGTLISQPTFVATCFRSDVKAQTGTKALTHTHCITPFSILHQRTPVIRNGLVPCAGFSTPFSAALNTNIHESVLDFLARCSVHRTAGVTSQSVVDVNYTIVNHIRFQLRVARCRNAYACTKGQDVNIFCWCDQQIRSDDLRHISVARELIPFSGKGC